MKLCDGHCNGSSLWDGETSLPIFDLNANETLFHSDAKGILEVFLCEVISEEIEEGVPLDPSVGPHVGEDVRNVFTLVDHAD